MAETWTLQGTINSGMAWRLEGAYGRAAMGAIEDGQCLLGRESHRDYYGNYVPSRYEVQSGTKGSLGYANRIRARRDLDPLTEDEFDQDMGCIEYAEDEDYDDIEED